jgi:amino-acid N-acetyltransferase
MPPRDTRPDQKVFMHETRENTTVKNGVIRKARLSEVTTLKALIDTAARDGQVLARDLAELYTNVRDFQLYVDEYGPGGCVALHIDMVNLAEIRTLVVREDLRGRGIGRRLLDTVLREAQGLELPRVYVFTRVPAFFSKCGFFEVSKDELPWKVFKDCMRCPLFPGCDEAAMIRDLDLPPA